MAQQSRQALEVARQFRKAIALDLVTNSAQAAYDFLVATVKQGQESVAKGTKPSREHVLSAQALIRMAGLTEPAPDTEGRELSKLSLAELEKMIADLRVIEHDAAEKPSASKQVSDMLS